MSAAASITAPATVAPSLPAGFVPSGLPAALAAAVARAGLRALSRPLALLAELPGEHIADSAWVVASGSSAGVAYVVRVAGARLVCPCPGCRRAGTCSHCAFVRLHLLVAAGVLAAPAQASASAPAPVVPPVAAAVVESPAPVAVVVEERAPAYCRHWRCNADFKDADYVKSDPRGYCARCAYFAGEPTADEIAHPVAPMARWMTHAEMRAAELGIAIGIESNDDDPNPEPPSPNGGAAEPSDAGESPAGDPATSHPASYAGVPRGPALPDPVPAPAPVAVEPAPAAESPITVAPAGLLACPSCGGPISAEELAQLGDCLSCLERAYSNPTTGEQLIIPRCHCGAAATGELDREYICDDCAARRGLLHTARANAGTGAPDYRPHFLTRGSKDSTAAARRMIRREQLRQRKYREEGRANDARRLSDEEWRAEYDPEAYDRETAPLARDNRPFSIWK
ncbi:MAG: hypothetical protein OJF49_003228 [Ktedonobacterales bacterium]|nr:MAG: hypothetical protein OJF49_003228 [Ktedonobacterales bacterium]